MLGLRTNLILGHVCKSLSGRKGSCWIPKITAGETCKALRSSTARPPRGSIPRQPRMSLLLLATLCQGCGVSTASSALMHCRALIHRRTASMCARHGDSAGHMMASAVGPATSVPAVVRQAMTATEVGVELVSLSTAAERFSHALSHAVG